MQSMYLFTGRNNETDIRDITDPAGFPCVLTPDGGCSARMPPESSEKKGGGAEWEERGVMGER